MYQKHFGLTQRPFSIAPDPRFLYMSLQHREALAHLLYGVGEGGGFVQLTGEVGTGKTTICRCLLEQLPEHVNLALILNPRVSAQELLASLCDELQIQYARDTTSIKSLTDVLSTYLLEGHSHGQRTVLMIDEAQNLSADALEQVRLLTNLETTREKLLQIILVGQPELRDLLAREDLRQLSQRITARYHLEPISRAETAAYIRHRLQICGASEPIFTEDAIDLIQKLSGGVPRLINVLCDRAMLGAFVEGRRRIDEAIVRRAAGEVLPEEGLSAPISRAWLWAVAAIAAVAIALSLFLFWNKTHLKSAPPPVAVLDVPVVPAPVVDNVPEAAALAGHEEPTPVALSDLMPVGSVGVDPPVLELRQVLANAGPDAVTRAWAELYRLWGIQANVRTDEQACAQAPGVGLRCLQGSGSWTVLSYYDRPALLMLVASGGRHVPMLLQEVLGSEARIQLDGRELVVPVTEVERYWFGEYRLLWRTPPEGMPVLRPGDRSTDVAWLRDRLQTVTGMTSITADPNFYDAGLKALVQSFQRDQELKADGVAGARTLINLNNLEKQTGVPRLGVSRS
ncbi:General secretion pathway protein A [hydrothermal vent metagenome]|uniref:General secretion pathway protein A n=1 Tax=hydrothermal vent metagenome TaxID=652676 RepID=A0A3B0Y7E2_9ZZZZ